jgi:type I protein arginine methyltransferase
VTYGVHDYGRMMADRTRMRAYLDAMRAVVRPGHVVLDLGTGAGIHALYACRLGARRVYAVETNAAIELARELAVANGLADRITFIRAASTDVTLPEKADVIVSDLRGVLPLYGAHLESLADARARHLAEGGVMLPAVDHLCASVVEAPDAFDRLMGPWLAVEGSLAAELSLDLSRGASIVAGGIYPDVPPLEPAQQLSPSARWASVTYGEPPSGLVSGVASGAFTRDGTAHGLALWFDAEILAREGGAIGYSNAPGTELVYGRGFAPFPEPVRVAAGATFSAHLFARRTEDDYLWGWTTHLTDAAGASRTFRQSSAWQVEAWPHRQGTARSAARAEAAAHAVRLLAADPDPARVVDALGAAEAPLSREDARALVRAVGPWLFREPTADPDTQK